jgi:hypothetical protein
MLERNGLKKGLVGAMDHTKKYIFDPFFNKKKKKKKKENYKRTHINQKLQKLE